MPKTANRHSVHHVDASTHHLVVRQQYSGPLPPPSELEHYERAHPGLAERIICLAEQEAAHRREMEMTELREGHAIEMSGLELQSKRLDVFGRIFHFAQWFAFLIAILGISSSAYVMVHGSQVGGSILAGGTLASIVTAFLYGKRQEKTKDE